MIPDTLHLALSIFLLPVLAFALMAIFHHRLPRHGDWLATSTLGLCLMLSLVIFSRAVQSGPAILVNVSHAWLPLGKDLFLRGGMMVDKLSAVMLVVVTLVSFLVHLFSIKYMEGDRRYGRYYCGLLIFSASMLGLVLANNLLTLFIFWELVGLSSYLLIGHWYEKKSASDAAIKAFITTRIGDIGMFIGLLICYVQVGSLDYADLFSAVELGDLGGSLRFLASLGIFFGAMGKSAQFPLHVWLPDAMEGPTPVSALIHAATMVAAGVYLTGRMLPLFDDRTLLIIAYVGGFTALFSATIALVQDDIKKVLAYSTVSQLGYMTLALGVGGYSSGLFHLTTHAFFKACLFLGSGAVIHAMHHEQSLSKYGGLWRKMPKTAFCYLLATLALVGFPGFSGFWSKDAILADTLAFSVLSGRWFLSFAGFATVMLTAFYMFRQFFLTFSGSPRDPKRYEHAHEAPWQMLAPLVLLGVLSVFGGGSGKWFEQMNPKLSAAEQIIEFDQSGTRTELMKRVLESPQPPEQHSSHDEHLRHWAHLTAMKVSTGLALAGMILAALMYFERRAKGALLNPNTLARHFPGIRRLLLGKYFLDEFYRAFFVWPVRHLGAISAVFDRSAIDGVVNALAMFSKVSSDIVEIIDRLIVDGALVVGIARTADNAGRRLSAAQTGYVRQYLLFTAVGIVVISGFCVLIL